MKFVTLLLLVVLMPAGVWAGLDPDPDQMGLYFDPLGETVSIEAAFATQVPVYILYTNPTLTAVRGFECGLTVLSLGPSTYSIIVNTVYPVQGLNIGQAPGATANYIVGYTEPVPTSAPTILAQVNLIYLDDTPLYLFLGPADPASLDSDLPIVMGEDYALLKTGLSAPDGPAATINAEGVVIATEKAPWDSIKALYR